MSSHTDEVFEVYLRNADGDTQHLPLREGMKKWLSEEGYRISLNVEGVVITLRRGTKTDADSKFMDEYLSQVTEDVMATIRGL